MLRVEECPLFWCKRMSLISGELGCDFIFFGCLAALFCPAVRGMEPSRCVICVLSRFVRTRIVVRSDAFCGSIRYQRSCISRRNDGCISLEFYKELIISQLSKSPYLGVFAPDIFFVGNIVGFFDVVCPYICQF